MTPLKTRVLAGGAHTSKQQIVRIDRGPVGQPLSRSVQQRLLARLDRAARRAGALLLADYHFGAAPPAVLASLKTRPTVVTLDSRFRIMSFRGVTAATPNVAEVGRLGVRIADDDLSGLGRAAERVRAALGARALVVTRGSRGMSVFEKGARPLHIPAFGSDEVTDVTGAGDTVISAFTLALAAGGRFPQAARIANVAGGIVVMKRGTATVSGPEILGAISGGSPPQRDDR
jgi:rfaE bifunctional protein kinase chain/domain